MTEKYNKDLSPWVGLKARFGVNNDARHYQSPRPASPPAVNIVLPLKVTL